MPLHADLKIWWESSFVFWNETLESAILKDFAIYPLLSPRQILPLVSWSSVSLQLFVDEVLGDCAFWHPEENVKKPGRRKGNQWWIMHRILPQRTSIAQFKFPEHQWRTVIIKGLNRHLTAKKATFKLILIEKYVVAVHIVTNNFGKLCTCLLAQWMNVQCYFATHAGRGRILKSCRNRNPWKQKDIWTRHISDFLKTYQFYNSSTRREGVLNRLNTK
jgi:hypothetical protein